MVRLEGETELRAVKEELNHKARKTQDSQETNRKLKEDIWKEKKKESQILEKKNVMNESRRKNIV